MSETPPYRIVRAHTHRYDSELHARFAIYTPPVDDFVVRMEDVSCGDSKIGTFVVFTYDSSTWKIDNRFRDGLDYLLRKFNLWDCLMLECERSNDSRYPLLDESIAAGCVDADKPYFTEAMKHDRYLSPLSDALPPRLLYDATESTNCVVPVFPRGTWHQLHDDRQNVYSISKTTYDDLLRQALNSRRSAAIDSLSTFIDDTVQAHVPDGFFEDVQFESVLIAYAEVVSLLNELRGYGSPDGSSFYAPKAYEAISTSELSPPNPSPLRAKFGDRADILESDSFEDFSDRASRFLFQLPREGAIVSECDENTNRYIESLRNYCDSFRQVLEIWKKSTKSGAMSLDLPHAMKRKYMENPEAFIVQTAMLRDALGITDSIRCYLSGVPLEDIFA